MEEIIWQAPEFRHNDKDISWYWLTIIITIILLLVAIWQGNLLFGLFVIIAEIMLLFWAKQYPRIIQFKIDKKGVHLGRIKSYSFEEILGFHIIEENNNEGGELILKIKSRLHPYVKILLLNNDIPQIKDFLKEKLNEIEYEESFSDSISKIIGF